MSEGMLKIGGKTYMLWVGGIEVTAKKHKKSYYAPFHML